MFLFSKPEKLSSVETMLKCGEASSEQVDLNCFDEMLCKIYTSRVFFYENTLDPDVVKNSLQATLKYYPMISGRLVQSKTGYPKFLLNDAGVKFTLVHLSTSMPNYSPTNPSYTHIKKYLHSTPVVQIVNYDTPLYYVNLTQFHGGGSALGLVMNHALTDGYSHADFLRNWSYQARFGKILAPPTHNRTSLVEIAASAPPAPPEFMIVGMLDRHPSTKLLLAGTVIYNLFAMSILIYHIDKIQLEKMKEEASVGLPEGEWITTNQVVYSKIWKILTALKIHNGILKRDEEAKLYCIQSVRQLFPSAEKLFCNMVQTCAVSEPAGKAVNLKPSEAAYAFKQAFASSTESIVKQSMNWMFNNWHTPKADRFVPEMLVNPKLITFINDYSRFGFYEFDLGSGTPVWYEMPASPVNSVFINPTKDGGRTIHFSLYSKDYALLDSPQWKQAFFDNAEFEKLIKSLHQ